MGNRAFADMAALRKEVIRLVGEGRIRWTVHAQFDHPEIPQVDKLAIVQWGGADQPNERARPGEPSYVCWARHPVHGLCRGVYAVVDTKHGPYVRIITVFKEE